MFSARYLFLIIALLCFAAQPSYASKETKANKLYNQVLIFKRQGLDEKALELCREIVEEYPGQSVSIKANEMIDTLTQRMKEQEEKIRAKAVARGRVLFDGKPLQVFTDVEPVFWFRDEVSGRSLDDITVEYSNGQYWVFGLEPGRYGISINVNANTSNPGMYPGDYQAWHVVTLNGQDQYDGDIHLKQIIHLNKPQSNAKVIDKWGNPWWKKIILSNPVQFSWNSLGENARYQYLIYKGPDNKVKSGETTETTITVELPPSNDAEVYSFKINAMREDRWIGMLITHGSNGHGWDYRFRVGNPLAEPTYQGRTAVNWLNDLRSKNYERQVAAVEALAKLYPLPEKIVRELIGVLAAELKQVAEKVTTLKEFESPLIIEGGNFIRESGEPDINLFQSVVHGATDIETRLYGWSYYLSGLRHLGQPLSVEKKEQLAEFITDSLNDSSFIIRISGMAIIGEYSNEMVPNKILPRLREICDSEKEIEVRKGCNEIIKKLEKKNTSFPSS